nr:DUF983 domain-containing protein [Hyphomicrobium denitrificans]
MVSSSSTSPSPFVSGLKCACPRCGKAPLFAGPLNPLAMRDKCDACGLDYKFVDTGDGPAVFGIFILGFLCVGGALIAEFKFGVPWWMHIILWGILTPIFAVFLLRFLKATLIALQFSNKAEEGRIAKE